MRRRTKLRIQLLLASGITRLHFDSAQSSPFLRSSRFRDFDSILRQKSGQYRDPAWIWSGDFPKPLRESIGYRPGTRADPILARRRSENRGSLSWIDSDPCKAAS